MGCVSQDSYPRKSILREPGNLGSKHTVKFSKGIWDQIRIRERKGPSRGTFQKCALTSVVLARKNWRTVDMRIRHMIYEHFRATESYEAVAGAHFQETRRTIIRNRFKSVFAHDEQKRLKVRKDLPAPAHSSWDSDSEHPPLLPFRLYRLSCQSA